MRVSKQYASLTLILCPYQCSGRSVAGRHHCEHSADHCVPTLVRKAASVAQADRQCCPLPSRPLSATVPNAATQSERAPLSEHYGLSLPMLIATEAPLLDRRRLRLAVK